MKLKQLFFLLFAILLFLPSSAQAATQSIQISPLTLDFNIKNGDSSSNQIIIKNPGTAPMDYSIETQVFNQVNDQGAPSFTSAIPEQTGVTTLADWINVTGSKSGTLAPSEEKTIPFTINIPAWAEPGGHYAAIFAKSGQKTASGATELGVSSRVGTLILVSVPGNTIKTNKIVSFSAPSFIWSGPVNLHMVVSNTGTIHYDSVGTVLLKSMIGAETKVDLGTHTILPSNERTYDGQWTKKYPLGMYNLTASATDGAGNSTIQTAVLWAIPIVPIILILLALILIIFIFRFIIKTHDKSVIKEVIEEEKVQEKKDGGNSPRA